jgi:hypothetical protein
MAQGRILMMDFVFLALTIGFLLLSKWLISGLERL